MMSIWYIPRRVRYNWLQCWHSKTTESNGKGIVMSYCLVDCVMLLTFESMSFIKRERVNEFHEERDGKQVSWIEKWSTSFMKMVNKFHEGRKGQQVSWKWSTSFMKGERVNKFHEGRKGQQVSWREKGSMGFMKGERVNEFYEERNGQRVSWREKGSSLMKGERVNKFHDKKKGNFFHTIPLRFDG